MSANNRHLRGNTRQIKGAVHGSVTVEPGDFIVVNTAVGYCGSSYTKTNATADNYLYPIASVVPATAAPVAEGFIAVNFVGIALTGSASGITNDITVGIDGMYRYPIIDFPSAVTLGSKVSAVSQGYANGGFSSSSNQAVANHGTATTNGTTAYLGHIIKTESGASFVDFKLWSGVYRKVLT